MESKRLVREVIPLRDLICEIDADRNEITRRVYFFVQVEILFSSRNK